MPQTASILIEVDDSAAISSFRQMSAEGAKLGPSLAPVGPALDKVTSSTKQSREAAQLLSEELGVNIPRGLRNILAENSVIGPAISAAFSGIAVAGFVTIVKDAVDQLTGFTAQMDTIAKQNQAIMDTTAQANKVLLGPQNLQQINAQILSTSKSIEKLNYELSLSGDSVTDSLLRGLSKYTSLGAAVVDELDREKAHLNDLTTEQAKLKDEQSRTDPIEVLKAENTAREAGLRGITAITQAEKDQAAVIDAQINANVTHEAVGQAQIVAIHKQALAQISQFEYQHAQASIQQTVQNELAFTNAEAATSHGIEQIYKQRDAQIQAINAAENAANAALEHDGLARTADFQKQRVAASTIADAKILEFHRQVANEMAQADSEAAVAMAAPWERSYVQIQEDYKSSQNKIKQDRALGLLDDEQAAQLSADAWQVSFAKTRDQLANDMETFFDDLTSGNIGQAFKKMFEDLVFQMVATWILGMNSMRAAASTGFGGGATGILGSLFGFGGGASGGPGGTPTFLGGLFGGGGGGGAPSASLGDLGSLGLLSSLGGFSASGAGGDIAPCQLGCPRAHRRFPDLDFPLARAARSAECFRPERTAAEPGGLLKDQSRLEDMTVSRSAWPSGRMAEHCSDPRVRSSRAGGRSTPSSGSAIAGPLLTAIAELRCYSGSMPWIRRTRSSQSRFLGPIGAAIGSDPLSYRLLWTRTRATRRESR